MNLLAHTFSQQGHDELVCVFLENERNDAHADLDRADAFTREGREQELCKRGWPKEALQHLIGADDEYLLNQLERLRAHLVAHVLFVHEKDERQQLLDNEVVPALLGALDEVALLDLDLSFLAAPTRVNQRSLLFCDLLRDDGVEQHERF